MLAFMLTAALTNAAFVENGELTCHAFKYPGTCTPAEIEAFDSERERSRMFFRCEGTWEILGQTEHAVIARCGPKKIRI